METTGGGLIKPLIVGNIYRPPRVLNCTIIITYWLYNIWSNYCRIF